MEYKLRLRCIVDAAATITKGNIYVGCVVQDAPLVYSVLGSDGLPYQRWGHYFEAVDKDVQFLVR